MALRETLKEATRDAHRALERLLGLDRPGLTLTGYRDYLKLTHAFYAGVEPRLRACPGLAALGVDLAPRSKTGWLERDLEYFGVQPVEVDAALLPAIGEGARALGCAYVLEGATLGGHVLHGMLAPRFDLAPGRGGTFLAGYGARTGAMWRGFVADLEAAGHGGADAASCVAGATQTFDRLGEWFRRSGWAPT